MTRKVEEKSKKPSAAVFVDGSNMFYLQKRLGWLIDWKKTKELLAREYTLKELRFYESYKDSPEDKRRFFEFLEKQGFVVVTKLVKYIIDSLTGKKLPWELRLAADKIVYLDDIKSKILRRKWDLTKKAEGNIVKLLYRRRS